jgi:hypothetical protein
VDKPAQEDEYLSDEDDDEVEWDTDVPQKQAGKMIL